MRGAVEISFTTPKIMFMATTPPSTRASNRVQS